MHEMSAAQISEMYAQIFELTFLVRTDFVMDGIPLVKRWLSSATRLRMQTTQARQIVRVTPLAQDHIMRNKEKNLFRYYFCRLRL